MNKRRQNTFLGELRAEMARFACLCVMVLAIPMLHPLAEAHAAENGFSSIICTSFGVTADARDDIPVGAPDDCPCIVLCHAMAASKVFHTLHWVPIVKESDVPGRINWKLAERVSQTGDGLLCGSIGIRGPPATI